MMRTSSFATGIDRVSTVRPALTRSAYSSCIKNLSNNVTTLLLSPKEMNQMNVFCMCEEAAIRLPLPPTDLSCNYHRQVWQGVRPCWHDPCMPPRLVGIPQQHGKERILTDLPQPLP